jgi:hypothetical protein
MMYTKPQLIAYPASAVIQSGTTQKAISAFEPHTMTPSQPAYEADE